MFRRPVRDKFNLVFGSCEVGYMISSCDLRDLTKLIFTKVRAVSVTLSSDPADAKAEVLKQVRRLVRIILISYVHVRYATGFSLLTNLVMIF